MRAQTIADWQETVYNTAASKGFHDDDDNVPPSQRFMLIIGEVNEAYEELRAGHGVTEVYYKEGKPEGVPIELADTVIRLFDFAQTYDINLAHWIAVKDEFNKTRPHKHGKVF